MASVKQQMKPTSFKAQELNKSKGIFDDHSVRKSMLTREGTITHTPANNDDIANKKYVDENAGSGLTALTTDEYSGSDCTGLTGEEDRTLDIGAIPKFIFVNNSMLHLNVDYSFSVTTVTFLNALWDTQPISVITTTGVNNFLGSDCSDSDGDTDRTLDVGGSVTMVFVNNSFLHLDVDYTLAGTIITFLNRVFDTQSIGVY